MAECPRVVWREPVSAPSKSLCALLWTFVQHTDDLVVEVKVDHLAWMTAQNERTVRRQLAELQESGLVERRGHRLLLKKPGTDARAEVSEPGMDARFENRVSMSEPDTSARFVAPRKPDNPARFGDRAPPSEPDTDARLGHKKPDTDARSQDHCLSLKDLNSSAATTTTTPLGLGLFELDIIRRQVEVEEGREIGPLSRAPEAMTAEGLRLALEEFGADHVVEVFRFAVAQACRDSKRERLYRRMFKGDAFYAWREEFQAEQRRREKLQAEIAPTPEPVEGGLDEDTIVRLQQGYAFAAGAKTGATQ